MICTSSEIHNIDFALSEFNNADMYNSGLELFQAMGYPVMPLRTVINNNINDFIYLKLNKRVLFNDDEQYLLDRINSFSFLFSLNVDNLSFKNRYSSLFNEIMFLAVDIDSSTRDRSFDAQSLTKILSKMIETPVFVIFSQESNILFSGIVYNEDKIENSEVVMSDWYSINGIDIQSLEKLSNLSFCYQSDKSLKDLYYDMLFSISRDYYIYPESKEYIMYGCLANEFTNLILEDEKSYSFMAISDYADLNSSYYKNLYEDDYVDNNDGIELLTSDDDLFFLDIEEFNFDEDDSDYEEFDENNHDDFYEDNNEVDDIETFDKLNDSLFNDPLQMLEWLGNDENDSD